MKKLILSIVLVFMAITLSAQRKTNYEKYWQAKEDSIKKSQAITESPVQRVDQEDTLQAIVDTLVQQNPDVRVNYFEYDPFYYSYNLGRFYHGGLNYWMYTDPWFYNNYWMMDMYSWNWEMGFMGNSFWYPWYYDNYGFGFGYFGWGYPWNNGYGHGFNHNNWYNHNNNNWYTHNGNHPYNNWYSHNGNHDYVRYNQNIGVHKQTAVQPQNKALYGQTKKSYSPSYNNPRMSTRPSYNNSRVTTGSVNRRVQTNTYSHTYSQPNTQRNNIAARNYSHTSRGSSYSIPSRGSVSQSRSYSNSGNYNSSGNYSRSSNSSSNYSSGSVSRSSGSSNYNSGSGVSRSSGGGTGRR
jgi:hypothetical protein